MHEKNCECMMCGVAQTIGMKEKMCRNCHNPLSECKCK